LISIFFFLYEKKNKYFKMILIKAILDFSK
jgi:hypothetical protein